MVARLASALYGSALAHVMTAEVAAEQAGAGGSYRREAWRAAGATGEGTAILLHYTAMRLASEVRAISERLPVDLGVMGAAAGAAEALKLLLEVCTVRSMDDPRAATVTTNLSRASEQLAAAAERIGTPSLSHTLVLTVQPPMGGRTAAYKDSPAGQSRMPHTLRSSLPEALPPRVGQACAGHEGGRTSKH